MLPAGASRRIAMVVKGYPRLSETFIAQEILALQRRGLEQEIWSLRQPTDPARHPMHRRIHAPVNYLPEYLHRGPIRVLRGALWCARHAKMQDALRVFLRDLRRDPTVNRVRRLGQAFVLARELRPEVAHLHVHYLHTPASVVRYAALLTGRTWTVSAHAKDVWTTPEWEKREKLRDAAWAVACTRQSAAYLQSLAPDPERISLIYHGLDLTRFPEPPPARPRRDGSDPADPVRIVSVGRLVAKKGYDDLIHALTALPKGLHWRFAHVGGGELKGVYHRQAAAAGIDSRCAFLGARPQPEVIALLREGDIFVLPSKTAPSGDRDGLPNVLMEAASQKLPIIGTEFAGIPEFIRTGIDGELVAPGDWEGLSNALNLLARDPDRRVALGDAAYRRLCQDFSMEGGIDQLETRFRSIAPEALSREPS
jgi:glycosyltransferase involved in cell wall biosynthesis